MKICCAGKTYWPELKMNLSFTQMCRLKFIFFRLFVNSWGKELKLEIESTAVTTDNSYSDGNISIAVTEQ